MIRKIIKNKLNNFNNYNTWKYEILPKNRKIIRSKFIFKIKYNFNNLIQLFKTWLIILIFF